MKRFTVLTFLLAITWSIPASAFRLEKSADMYMDIDLLVQFQVQAIQNGSPDKTSWGKEFFMRRTRLMVGGQVTKYISFFAETDMPNWGRGNDWDKPTFFVQDAFVTFKVVDEFMVDGGLLIVPFSRHGYQSAVSLLAMDYHSDLIRYPSDSTKVWRDAGAQVRGYIFQKRLQYRFAVVSGSENDVMQKDIDDKAVLTTNPKDYPRFVAHVRYNVFGEESDMFAKGIYFSPTPILSFGLSFDYQKDGGVDRYATFIKDGAGKDTATIDQPGELGDYMAVAADMFAEVPFLGGDHEFIIHADFYRYWHGDASKSSGLGLFGEIGYRYKVFSPIFGVDWFMSDIDKQDLLVIHGGLAWWAMRHNANLKMDVAARRQGDITAAPFSTTISLQAQVFF